MTVREIVTYILKQNMAAASNKALSDRQCMTGVLNMEKYSIFFGLDLVSTSIADFRQKLSIV